jgi:hypothetical protein
MNLFLNRQNFNTLGENEIASFIDQAESMIIIAIPSLTVGLAQSIIDAKASSKQIVFAQYDPTQCRTSEHADAIKILIEHNIILRISDAFAIGTLVIDGRGWLFTTVSKSVQCVNSYAVSMNEAQRLIDSLSAKVVNEPVSETQLPELGERVLIPEIIERLEEEKQELVIQEEREQVANVEVEFVELEFRGIRLGSRKVAIPKELTQLGMDEKVKDILSSSAKLFNGQHSFIHELKKLEENRNQIRNDYLFTIKEYGTMIRKKRKEKFNESNDELEKDIKKVQQSIQKQIDKELVETKKALIEYYVPLLKSNPPTKLLKYSDDIDDKTAAKIIDNLLSSALPRAETIVQDIQLICHYKGVSIELLKDEKFIGQLDQTINKHIENLFDEEAR